ncbi:glycosyltransferase family 4 protein, partial [Methylobacterium trifolii]
AGWLGRIPLRGRLRYLARTGVMPLFTVAATVALRRHRDAVVVSHGDSLKGDILVVHAVNAASLAEKRRGGDWRWRLNPMHAWVGLRDHLMIGGLRYRTYVAVSDRVSTELQQHYRVPEDRIRVIPNGIDLARFRREPEAGRAIRREFGIPPEARLLVFAGHEFARKGLSHVIGALERMPADTWLLVVGSDNPAPYRRLAQSAADRLVFAGHRTDMPAIYAAADAFVLPTAYETFSLVCMEAMACGLPVFATRVGGIEDYLVDGQSGFGILPESADIADKLAHAFADPALMERLGAGARETASRFGWDRVAQIYLGLIAEVRAAKRAG